MKTHPADGLYYVDTLMLARAGACHLGSQLVPQLFGKDSAKATLQNMTKMQRNGYTYRISWLVWKMRQKGHINDAEVTKFNKAPYKERPKAFMDLLLKRAQREGRV